MPATRPAKEITRWTTQRNSGRSCTVTLVALHESVGITNAYDLALFCERKGVSYHDIADLDTMVHAVRFTDTAWHLRNGNPHSVGLCLTTPVRGYSRSEWLGPQVRKVETAAWWMARSCKILGIPIRDITHPQIRSALKGDMRSAGGTTHNNYTLATGDGTHTDPRNFPTDVCVRWALEAAGQPIPVPTPPTAHPFPLPRDEYFGLITGPKKSHGGINAWEQGHVRSIQQALIRKGYVPGVTNPSSGWADGKFEQPTKDAVTRFQRREMRQTTRFGEVWWDDWDKLFR